MLFIMSMLSKCLRNSDPILGQNPIPPKWSCLNLIQFRSDTWVESISSTSIHIHIHVLYYFYVQYMLTNRPSADLWPKAADLFLKHSPLGLSLVPAMSLYNLIRIRFIKKMGHPFIYIYMFFIISMLCICLRIGLRPTCGLRPLVYFLNAILWGFVLEFERCICIT